MKLLILVSVTVAATYASSQGYNVPTRPRPKPSYGGSGFTGGSGFSSGSSGFTGGSGFSSGSSGFSLGDGGFSSGSGIFSGGGSGGFGGSCGQGQVRHSDGSCVTPVVTRNLYVYQAPPTSPIVGPRPQVPPPRVEHNIIFIRAPKGVVGQEPVVVPPPQQKNIVYILNKRQELDQQVIQVPEPEQQTPEVFFVNYAEGENPTLPTGEDLQSALSIASQGDSDVIGGETDFGNGIAINGIAINGAGGDIGGGGYNAPSVSTPSSAYAHP